MAQDDDNRTISYPGHGVGLRNVGSYQVAGHPFLTGSILTGSVNDGTFECNFPYVTKHIRIYNTGSVAGGPFIVHFTPMADFGGPGAYHYQTVYPYSSSAHGIQQGAIAEFDVKCTRIFCSLMETENAEHSGVRIYASLTNIPAKRMYALTGAGLTD